MIVVKTQFDGQTIQTPRELQGARPGQVTIVFDERQLAPPHRSIWDFFGLAAQQRSAQDISAQVDAERNAWTIG